MADISLSVVPVVCSMVAGAAVVAGVMRATIDQLKGTVIELSRELAALREFVAGVSRQLVALQTETQLRHGAMRSRSRTAGS